MLPVNQFKDYIAHNNLFTPGSKVLAAASGGMDSVLMAHLLKAAGFTIAIAHCNFQLRGDEANGDQQFCKSLAEQLDVPFHTINFDTQSYATEKKISIQMAARELRYQWFDQLRQQNGYDSIALAHHQNDAIETILLNLTRGTGIAGLHGILPKNGHLVRPLLFLKREDVAKLIEENKLDYVEDSSNASVKYARNKLRHEVIPKLKELNPNLEQTFENNMRHFRDMELLLELRLSEIRNELLTNNGDSFSININKVKELQPQHLLLFKLLQDFGFSETVVDDLVSVLDKHSGRVFESETHQLLLDREKLIITPKHKHVQESIAIAEDTREVNYGGYKLNILHDDSALIIKDNPLALSVDADKLIYPLSIRPWQTGDVFYPLGMKTRKKLSDYFIQQKIPLSEKNSVPLLINGNGEIIWVAGYRPDERYRVGNNTKKVTIFELIKI